MICHGFIRTNFPLSRFCKVTDKFNNKPLFMKEEKIVRTTDLKFTIFGGGAFGLAMAKVLSDKSVPSVILVRNESFAHAINARHQHPKYLSQYLLSPLIQASTSVTEAMNGCTHIIHAIPMQASRDFLMEVKDKIPCGVPILSVTKGIEQQTFCLMSEILNDTLGPNQSTAYLSGPSFAEEIINSLATAVVIASSDPKLAKSLSTLLSSGKFRCHTSTDVKVLNSRF